LEEKFKDLPNVEKMTETGEKNGNSNQNEIFSQ
jgi:hypothetical protein